MNFLKRIFLFGLVNILVMVTLTIIVGLVSSFLGVNLHGSTYGGLAVFALIWGMGGSVISLFLSKTMVKWSMGVRIINPGSHSPEERELVATVHRLSRAAGITKMPEVGIYESPEVNAFATGPTKNSALIAVSRGLLHSMGRNEVEGVLGHEVAHAANGDMVTMTLVQGIVNAFVIFISRIVAFFLVNAMRGNRDQEEGFGGGMLHIGITIALEIALGFLGMIVVAWFSRFREFRADAGGAKLAGREKMIGALQALQRTYGVQSEVESNQSVAALKISGKTGGLMALFSTHPPLEERIKRLSRGNF